MAKSSARLTLTPDEVRILWVWANHIENETTLLDCPHQAGLQEKLQKFLLASGDLQPTGFKLS